MLTKRIIACLDVDAGRVVKGVQFSDLRDAGDPAEMALTHGRAGADEVVLLGVAVEQARDGLRADHLGEAGDGDVQPAVQLDRQVRVWRIVLRCGGAWRAFRSSVSSRKVGIGGTSSSSQFL